MLGYHYYKEENRSEADREEQIELRRLFTVTQPDSRALY